MTPGPSGSPALHGPALLAFLIIAFIVASSMLVGAALLRVRPRKHSPLKPLTYECGETASGLAWVRFHARYYVVALFFVLFDIEAALLLPWSTLVRESAVPGFVAVASFVGVLMLGWLWAVRKRALEWQ